MRCALAIALTGCVVVPVTRTTTSVIQRTMSAPVPDEPGWLALDASLHGSTLVGAATWRRDCVRTMVELQRVTQRRRADVVNIFAGTRDEPGAWLLAPVTLIPSGIVTAIIVLASHAKTTRHEESTTLLESCPVPAASIAMAVTLPSGATLDGTTDATGRFEIEVPSSETAGTVIVQAHGAEDRSLRYTP